MSRAHLIIHRVLWPHVMQTWSRCEQTGLGPASKRHHTTNPKPSPVPGTPWAATTLAFDLKLSAGITRV